METIYYNAAVYTGKLPLQQAFGVENGQFTFVGTNEKALARPAAKYVDLDGRFVCAGFNDSHMHLVNYGRTLFSVPLSFSTHSLADTLQRLREARPRGGWILGRGWNQDYFNDASRMPTRYDLDRVSRDVPVCAIRVCGHVLAVNSAALKLLGITAETPQPEGGEIGMENGTPNGLFFDNAMDLVLSAIPAPTKEELKEMILAACSMLNARGITSCHSDDYSTFPNLPWQTVNQAYQELEAEGKLTVRVYEQANFTTLPQLQEFLQAGNHTGTGSHFFRIGPLKMLGDGSLGSRTAYLSKPYADAPHTRGLSVFTPEEFDTMIGYAHQQGMQTAVHCIGDACLDLVLDSLEKAMQAHPRQDHRHGIVHCQITRPEQLERIARLGLHVYAQSIFLDYDSLIVNARVGRELAATSYSWKTLMKLGATVSNGSDCPVEEPDVLAGIQCAVTRQPIYGVRPYLAKQAFTLRQALDSYTRWGAYASFEEKFKGCIAPGMAADFVVLSYDPFEESPFELKDLIVLKTYLGGEQVFPGQNDQIGDWIFYQ